jgi:hypothetical protein
MRRVARAWMALAPDQRLAAVASIGLFASMFLPWYQKSTVPNGTTRFVSSSVSAFGVFSFVEGAVLLVAVAVLALLFFRAERRAFHLPGGDGTVIMAAGIWIAVLLFYRVFDRPSISGSGGTVGIQWGFFIAFVAAGALAYAGSRVRAAHRPEPVPGAADERRRGEPGQGSGGAEERRGGEWELPGEAEGRRHRRRPPDDAPPTRAIPLDEGQTELLPSDPPPPDRLF